MITDTCDGCANLVTPSERHALVAWPATTSIEQPELLYACQQCGYVNRRKLELRRAVALAETGINVIPAVTLVPQPPDEVNDPARTHPQPLSPDDLLDLHQLLAMPQWQAELKTQP